MKKLLVCALSGILIYANISSASAVTNNAVTNNKINVSLENIEDIMINNSPQMKIADNNLKKAEKEYKDVVDKYDSNLDRREDTVDDLQNELDNVNNTQTGSSTGDANSTSSSKRNISDIKEDLKSAKKDLRDFKKSKEKAKYDLESAKLQYEKTVKQSVLAAQKQYIDYLSSLSKKEISKRNLDAKNRADEVSKTKYEMGFMSQKEYKANSIGSSDLNNTLGESIKKQETDFKDLRTVLGIPLATEIIITNDINVDLDKVSKINFKEDLDKMLENNIDIQIKDIESEETDLSNEDYVMDNAEIFLQQQKDKAKLDFEKQYNTLMNSYNTLKNSNEKLNNKQYDFGVMQTKYSYGFVSKKQVDDLELELDKQKSDFESEKNNFYINYLQYLQMKEGY